MTTTFQHIRKWSHSYRLKQQSNISPSYFKPRSHIPHSWASALHHICESQIILELAWVPQGHFDTRKGHILQPYRHLRHPSPPKKISCCFSSPSVTQNNNTSQMLFSNESPVIHEHKSSKIQKCELLIKRILGDILVSYLIISLQWESFKN